MDLAQGASGKRRGHAAAGRGRFDVERGDAGVRSGRSRCDTWVPNASGAGSFVAWIGERLREITPWVRVLPDTQKAGRRARLTG